MDNKLGMGEIRINNWGKETDGEMSQMLSVKRHSCHSLFLFINVYMNCESKQKITNNQMYHSAILKSGILVLI